MGLDRLVVEVTRGSIVESVHHATVVVVDVSGEIVASAGDPDRRAFFRSSAKPFQAVPLITSGAADAFRFTESELAFCCSSHNGQPAQQDAVRAMLTKIGLGPNDLQCGIMMPADEYARARVAIGADQRSPLQHCCSGKHTGMLATCLHMGYPISSYLSQDHPLQRQIFDIVAGVMRIDRSHIIVAPDGCSVPTFAAPLASFAMAFATLARPEAAAAGNGGEYAVALDRLRTSMIRYPEHIAGVGEFDTDLMKATNGNVVAKIGAEGLLCMALPHHGLGIAVSIHDGSYRGLNVLAVSVLAELRLLDLEVLDMLKARLVPPVTNANGWDVGEYRTNLRFA